MTLTGNGTIRWGNNEAVDVEYKIEIKISKRDGNFIAQGLAISERYNALFNAQGCADVKLELNDGRILDINTIDISEGTKTRFHVNTPI